MNTKTTFAIAVAAGLLMYLLLRKGGKFSAPTGQIAAGTFADLISYGDTLNSSGDGKGADAIYRQAYAVAETTAEKVRSLGSLIVTSHFLSDKVSEDRYTVELRKIDPKNEWLSKWTINERGIFIFPINAYSDQSK